MPTDEDAAGRFQRASPPIYDPLTTAAQPGGTFTRQPFPGNVIPADRWDPVTAKLINAYPAADRPAGLANNLVTTPTRTQDWNQFDVRIDHTQPARTTSARPLLLLEDRRRSTPTPFPQVQLAGLSKAVGLGNEDTFAGPSDLLAEHAVLGWSHVFSPRLLLDTRFGYNHFDLDFTQADVEVGEQLGEQLGVPNANQQDAQAGIPIFSPAGYTGIGHSRSLPILRTRRTFQSVANLTFAADGTRSRPASTSAAVTWASSRPTAATAASTSRSNITNNPANNTGGHVMASFLLGAPSLIEQDYLLADVAIRGTEYSAYVADDWRATLEADPEPRAALRARHAVHRDVEPAGRTSMPATATVLIAGRNGVSETAGINTFKKVFAPRVGFAYHLGAGDRRARRRRYLLEHAGARRQRAPPASPRALRPHLQLQPRQPVRQPARERRLPNHPAARRRAAPTIRAAA